MAFIAICRSCSSILHKSAPAASRSLCQSYSRGFRWLAKNASIAFSALSASAAFESMAGALQRQKFSLHAGGLELID